MRDEIKEKAIEQLTFLIDRIQLMRAGGPGADYGSLTPEICHELVPQIAECIVRIGGSHSAYHAQADRILRENYLTHQPGMLFGVLNGLRDAVRGGHLDQLIELIHAEVFNDALDQANHLLGEGFKTPATVIAGVSLETHLRTLCKKHSVDIEYKDSKGILRAKKASVMNDDLAKAKVYSGGDQKQVTAWLDKRNDAAHGKDGKITDPEIQLMIDGIRNFFVRNPA